MKYVEPPEHKSTNENELAEQELVLRQLFILRQDVEYLKQVAQQGGNSLDKYDLNDRSTLRNLVYMLNEELVTYKKHNKLLIDAVMKNGETI